MLEENTALHGQRQLTIRVSSGKSHSLADTFRYIERSDPRLHVGLIGDTQFCCTLTLSDM